MAKDTIEVLALQPGFYGGNRIREGQKFHVEAGTKAKWFVPAGTVAAKAQAVKPAKDEKTALSELGKGKPSSFVDSVGKGKGKPSSFVDSVGKGKGKPSSFVDSVGKGKADDLA